MARALVMAAVAFGTALGARAAEPGGWVGPGACASRTCHGSPTPRTDRRDAAGRPTLRHDEYTVWSTLDPHHRAYGALLGPRGRQIAERLGMIPTGTDEATWPQHAADAARCLDCHALVPASVHDRPAESDWRDDGVSCEACHGPAGGWLRTHTRANRPASLAAGMVETMEPARVAERACVRCHVGTPARSVTHELLAAGHPPLHFELDFFARSMPRHWNVHAGNEAWAGAGPLLAGDEVAIRAASRLFAHGGGHRGWPDFAAYDCAACHHVYGRYDRERVRDAAGEVTGYPPPDRSQETVFRIVATPLERSRRAAATEPAAALATLVARASRQPLSPVEIRASLRALVTRAVPLARAGYATGLQAFWAADALVEGGAVDADQLAACRRLLDRVEADVRFRSGWVPDRFARDLSALGPLLR